MFQCTRDIYFGVCPRNSKKGTKISVSRIKVFWADLDAKDYKGGMEEARNRFSEFPLPPTVVICSGYGYHAYWLLEEELTNKNLAEAYLRKISNYLSSDKSVCDVSRVLRLPNIFNRKKSENPLEVSIFSFNKDLIYALSDFDKVLGENEKQLSEVATIQSEIDSLSEGNRNTTFARIIGKLHSNKYSIEEIYSLLKPHADKCNFPVNELSNEIKGICSRYPVDSEKKNQAAKLVELVKSKNIKFIHDQYHEPHFLSPDQKTHAINMRSKLFKRWLSKIVWDDTSQPPSSAVINDSMGVLEGIALHASPQVELHLRLAFHENSVYYNLEKGKVVKIDSNGWEVVTESPVLFRQLNHQKQQIMPLKGKKLFELLKSININHNDPSNPGLLLLVWITLSFIPGFPHPPLIIHGPQGTAKSTLTRMLKMLIDPSKLEQIAPPTNLKEFVLTLSRHWLIPLDNISSLPIWMSDALCRACTGDGFSKRELYTDSDEVIYSFRSVIILNGINLVADMPDLLDRSILLELCPISNIKRKEECRIRKEFDELRPYYLGAIFDLVSSAIAEYPKVNLNHHPRMADFARWGVAVTRALGFRDEDFYKAYNINILNQHQESINSNVVARVVLEIMKGRSCWEGTASELLGMLNQAALGLNIDIKTKAWPKDSNWVWKRIVQVENNLKAFGIDIEKGDSCGQRYIKIFNKGKCTDSAVTVVRPEDVF